MPVGDGNKGRDHFPGWLTGTVRRWIAVMGAIGTVATVVGYALSGGRLWAWIAIGLLATLVVSFAWTACDEYNKRMLSERRAHQPPGGGLPLMAPVEYQVRALRQVIARIGETDDWFGNAMLDGVLKNLSRSGTDPLYEPLQAGACHDGLARLVELGELEPDKPHGWKIVRR